MQMLKEAIIVKKCMFIKIKKKDFSKPLATVVAYDYLGLIKYFAFNLAILKIKLMIINQLCWLCLQWHKMPVGLINTCKNLHIKYPQATKLENNKI